MIMLWVPVWLVFAGALALGAMTLVLALVAVPAILLAHHLLTRWRPTPPTRRGPSVYEGEFRVLEETRVPEKGS